MPRNPSKTAHSIKELHNGIAELGRWCYLKAYRELESRVEGIVTARMSKTDRIRAVVDATLGKVTKRDILAKCPDISTSMVEMTLKALLDEGVIRKIGNGRAAAYVRNDEFNQPTS